MEYVEGLFFLFPLKNKSICSAVYSLFTLVFFILLNKLVSAVATGLNYQHKHIVVIASVVTTWIPMQFNNLILKAIFWLAVHIKELPNIELENKRFQP